MKKFIVNFLRISGAVMAFMVMILVVSIVGSGIYTFSQEKTVKMPFGLVEFLYQKTSSGGFDIEINFINYFFHYVVITIVCITLIVLAIKYLKDTRNLVYSLLIFLAVLIAIFSKNFLSQPMPFKSISEVGINRLLKKEENAIIYVGRDNCPDCIEYKPKLTNFLEKNKKTILFFDVSGSDKEIGAFRKYYNSLGVEGVPAIIVVKNGKIRTIYYGDKAPDKVEKEILAFK